ncbi:hypothetical protein J4Q44_G00051860, partial [Coregonus suidteri]
MSSKKTVKSSGVTRMSSTSRKREYNRIWTKLSREKTNLKKKRVEKEVNDNESGSSLISQSDTKSEDTSSTESDSKIESDSEVEAVEGTPPRLPTHAEEESDGELQTVGGTPPRLPTHAEEESDGELQTVGGTPPRLPT